MFPWRQFANYPIWIYIVSVVAPPIIWWKVPQWLPWIYGKISGDFPTPLYTIMGFILTAVAIIIATNDAGRLSELSDETPRLWRQLINLFVSTAVLTGSLATALILLDSETIQVFSMTLKRVISATSLFLFTAAVLQFGTTLYVLAKFATAPRANRVSVPERHHYTVPEHLERGRQPQK